MNKEIKENTNTHINYNEFTKLNNELINTQREIIKKNAELEKLSKYKDLFLGMAAHDLKNPLHGIISISELLLDETMELSEQDKLEFLQMIHSSSNYMSAIINDLIDIAVIETGNLKLNLEKVNIVELISHVIDINQIIALNKGIEIIFKYDNVPKVLLDPPRIQQIIHNLLNNAIKFSYNNKKVYVSLTTQDNELIIIIEDEGQGIAKGEISELFVPFSKMTTKPIKGEESTGLGLAIVKNLVENHRGTIKVESKLGLGTRFVVSLPINEE